MRKRENNWDFDFMLSHDCSLMNKCSYILTNNARFYLPNVKLGIVADRVIGCFWPSFLVANILLLVVVAATKFQQKWNDATWECNVYGLNNSFIYPYVLLLSKIAHKYKCRTMSILANHCLAFIICFFN